MSREDKHFRLRIPDAVKDWVKERAQKNRRSMTAEIIFLLEEKMCAENEKSGTEAS